jgi:hypothetical protein
MALVVRVGASKISSLGYFDLRSGVKKRKKPFESRGAEIRDQKKMDGGTVANGVCGGKIRALIEALKDVDERGHVPDEGSRPMRTSRKHRDGRQNTGFAG